MPERWRVSILILLDYLFLYWAGVSPYTSPSGLFQSLFYWITYSYFYLYSLSYCSFTVSILILLDYLFLFQQVCRLQEVLFFVSILILLDYLFLYTCSSSLKAVYLSFNPYFTGLPILINGDRAVYVDGQGCFNPYFTGLPILIRSVGKTFYLLLLQSFFQTLKSSFS